MFTFRFTPEDNDKLQKILAHFREELREAIIRFYANEARSTDFLGKSPCDDAREAPPTRAGEIDGTD